MNKQSTLSAPQGVARRLLGGSKPAAVALAVSSLLAACSVTGPSGLDKQKITAVNEESQQLMVDRLAVESAKFAAVQNDLLKKFEQTRAAAVTPAVPEFNPLDAVNVTLKVDDTDVRFVFKAIADQAKLNLILPNSLSEKPRTISLALRNMPASQVFDHVLKTLDMHGAVERGVLIVNDYQERVFNLDFLQTSISANFNAGGDVFGANQSGGGGASGGDSASSGIRSGFNIRGRNTNDMDAFGQIELLLNSVIYDDADHGQAKKGDKAEKSEKATSAPRNPNGPRYVLNQSTGTLYVKGRPSQVATVSQQVANYKAVLGRQVLIEAQILDIELNDDFQYGVDWSRLKGNAAVAFGANPMSLGSITTSVPDASNPGRTLTIPASALGAAGTSQFGVAYGTPTQSIAINMLKTFGAVHVLSNPSIRVKNTQPAVVSVGRNERYISQTTSNVSNSGGGQSTTSANVITGNLFDGVMLGVIPFISDDGTINLTINPVQTTIKPGSSDLINVGTDQNPQRISLPKVDFKGITTSLSMRSGDMVILGGLIDESGNRAKSGLPGLAEVPILGEAFGTVNRTVRSRELIVVLRVRTL
jgi:MSHA type pilus biogenesis protein MshL